MEERYSGVDLLEALQDAHNYNDFLTCLIRGSTQARDLVDFGAGLGTFAKRLRLAGYRVVCVEPDSFQREGLLAQGFEAIADISSLRDNSAPFIFSLNVLEHIENDSEAIKQIYAKLQPGGLLLAYVPAFQCLWSSLDDMVGHYRRYRHETLQRLVRDEGFVIERTRYADSLGFIAAFGFRLLRRRSESLAASSIRFYDRWIFPVSRVLDSVLDRFVGKNVYVLCRKPN
jgi:SAM-dependent methyltransferase